MSEFMISVNSRARGERRQLPRTKKKGELRVRHHREDGSGLGNLHDGLAEEARTPRLLQPQTLQLRACLPNEKKTLTSKPHLPPRDPHHRLACWPASATIALLLLARLKGRLSPLRLQHPRPGTRFDTIGVGNIKPVNYDIHTTDTLATEPQATFWLEGEGGGHGW